MKGSKAELELVKSSKEKEITELKAALEAEKAGLEAKKGDEKKTAALPA